MSRGPPSPTNLGLEKQLKPTNLAQTKTQHVRGSNRSRQNNGENLFCGLSDNLFFDAFDATRVKLVIESNQDSMTRRRTALPISLWPI